MHTSGCSQRKRCFSAGIPTRPFQPAWPERHDEPFADRMNSITNHVVSSRLDGDLAWNNSFLLRGDVVNEVSKLKEHPREDILLYGSNELFNTLLDNALVDDLRVWVFPLVLGQGKRLFHDGNTLRNLELVDSTRFATGVVVLAFRPSAARGLA